jgi:hypothetical protein
MVKEDKAFKLVILKCFAGFVSGVLILLQPGLKDEATAVQQKQLKEHTAGMLLDALQSIADLREKL